MDVEEGQGRSNTYCSLRRVFEDMSFVQHDAEDMTSHRDMLLLKTKDGSRLNTRCFFVVKI